MEYYKIADQILAWDDREFSLLKGHYMQRFSVDSASVEMQEKILFKARIISLKPYITHPIVKENYVYAMVIIRGERLLIYHWGKQRFAFAVWPDRIKAEGINECLFDPDMIQQPPLNEDWFFGISGLHKALLYRGVMVLHASYICRNGKAVLFTAPSGTGKSTQAALWERFRNVEIINGDRVALRKDQKNWKAYGYPCCGSSSICRNRTLPIECIVVLRQGTENRVEPMDITGKIRCLTAATEVYLWDTEEVKRALELIEQLLDSVPVICLICRPDAEAVEVLNRYLEETEHAGTFRLSASKSIKK